MNDRELRDMEKLRSIDDYISEIKTVSELVCESKKADNKVGEILEMLTDALYEKYDYIIKESGVYRKKRSIFGKIHDYFEKKREIRRERKQEKKELKQKKAQEERDIQVEKEQPGACVLSPSQPPPEVEFIEDKSEGIKLLPNSSENPQN